MVSYNPRVLDLAPRGKQTTNAKPDSFRTKDGWFSCGLEVNLAQM